MGTTRRECSGEVEEEEDKEEEEQDEERNDILVIKEYVSVQKTFTRGVLHEETPLPRKKEREE